VSANFLRYVDAGHYDGGAFHRAVTMGNQPDNAVKIEVIQAGANPARANEGFGPIPLEPLWLVHLHQRSAGARFRRPAQPGRPGIRRIRPRRSGDGRRPPHPAGGEHPGAAAHPANQDSHSQAQLN